MKNRNIKNLWLMLLVLIMFESIANGQALRPNILFILMDDLGYSDVGFMPEASNDVHTPEIDVLAQEGTVFTSAHVTHSFCGPSRTSVMTGRMPHPLGAQYNLAAFSGNGIDTSETYISELLNEAGYYTGLVGKWHLGEETEFHPNSRGFDYFYGFLGGGHEYFSDTWLSHTTYNPANYSAGNYNGDYKRPMMKNSSYVKSEAGLYCTDILTDAGIEFLDNAAQDDEPFFLFMSYNAPHTPVQAKQSDIDSISSILGDNAAADGSERLTYTAMMYNVDYNIKRLVDNLQNSGEYDNTLIVFLSDNGGKTAKGAKNNPLKGGKGDSFEGGFRVPMFMHWPGGDVPQGYLNPNNYSSLDFFPTFAYLAGIDIPSEKMYDGINVWGNIVEKTDPRKDSSIFIMRPHNGNNYTGVVKNNYKLYTGGDGNWKLYDLSTDISETTDISSANSEIVDSMKRDVYEWTWTHIRPTFFDSPSYGFEEKWNNHNMPNFEKTFGSLFDSTDYNWDNWNEKQEPDPEPDPDPDVDPDPEPGTGTTVQVNNHTLAYVFPNPVRTTVNISIVTETNNIIDVALYDASAKMVQLEKELVQSSNNMYLFEVDPGIPNGIYFLEIKNGQKTMTNKIILSR